MGSLRDPAARLLPQWHRDHSVNDLLWLACSTGSGGEETRPWTAGPATSVIQQGWEECSKWRLSLSLPVLHFISLLSPLSSSCSSSLQGHILFWHISPVSSTALYVFSKEHGIGRSLGMLPWDRVPKVPVVASFVSLICIYQFSIYC